jgi:Bifunctional DNA primase/polymerase, N-terminal
MSDVVRNCPNCARMCVIHPCYAGCEDGVLLGSNVIPFPARYLPPDQPPAGKLDDHAQVMLRQALAYIEAGWQIFPLGRNKRPRIPSPHPKGHRCTGECGQEGHGFNDATSDPATILRWWAVEYPGSNIGLRPPPTVFILDTDPRKDNHIAALEIMARYGPLPHTLTVYSGKHDGGMHRYFRKPPGDLANRLLIPGFEQFPPDSIGIDLKGHGGLVVAAGSIHPATGHPYVEIDAPIVDCGWLAEFVIKQPPLKKKISQAFFTSGGNRCPGEVSPADWYTDNQTWSDVLLPHRWTPVSGAGDDDGDSWRHPSATASTSATISYGLLFVYTTSTVFEPTTGGDPHGYTRFRAYIELNHRGDLSAAAQSIREGR